MHINLFQRCSTLFVFCLISSLLLSGRLPIFPFDIIAFAQPNETSGSIQGDVVYTYDAIGRIVEATYKSGAKTNYTYDDLGNMNTIQSTEGSDKTFYAIGSFVLKQNGNVITSKGITEGNIQCELLVGNTDIVNKPARLIVSLYKDTKLVQMSVSDKTIVDAGKINPFRCNITVPENPQMYYVKAYLWSDLLEIKPICDGNLL